MERVSVSLDRIPKAPVINHENVLMGTFKIVVLCISHSTYRNKTKHLRSVTFLVFILS